MSSDDEKFTAILPRKEEQKQEDKPWEVIPPREEGDHAAEMVVDKLSEQLGTAPSIKGRGEIDYTILSNFADRADIIFMMYAKTRGRKTRFWREMFELYPKLLISMGGRGRRDIIRMAGVAKGGMPSVEAEIPDRPGWVGRNITQRNWKERFREDRL